MRDKSMEEILRESGLDYRQFLERVDNFAETTKRKCLNLVPQKQKCELTDSRLGGQPWLPSGFPCPLDEDGNEMGLLAQINFAQMPALDGFPKTGILQFYIAGDDLMGMNFKDFTKQSNFRVVYHKDVEDIHSISTNIDYSKFYFPLSTQLKIRFELTEKPMSCVENKFGELFNKAVGLEKNISLYDLPESVYDMIAEKFDATGHRIGGYPFFTQNDPRAEKPVYNKYTMQLLQIDSDDDIMWGDCGVCNFLIAAEDLAACKFDDVLYTWDCC